MIAARILQVQGAFTLDVEFTSSARVLGVFGPSGSGKTTLLHALAGVGRPREARLRIGDQVVQEAGARPVPPERRGLALVPQDPLLFPHLSTRANLAYAPGARRLLEEPHGREVVRVLGLEPLLARSTAHLSGGERQRVALGRALLARPRLLLLDEPSAALDAELSRAVLALLLEVVRSLDVSVVFVTHRTGELLALADDCLVLRAGRIVAQGPPVEALRGTRPDLVGIDNLMRLEVLERDEEGGVAWLDLGRGLRLCAPLTPGPVGERVDVGLFADEVLLCRGAPAGTSARNVLPARIERLDELGNELLASLRLGEQDLRVRLTRGAVRELALAPGQEVTALFKTTACHLLRA